MLRLLKKKRESADEKYSISVYEILSIDEAKLYIKLNRKKLKGNVIIK